MSCSNIDLFLNIRDHLLWIESYMDGSTVPVCINTTKEFDSKAESGNDFYITSEYFKLCINLEIFSIKKYPRPSLSNKNNVLEAL